MYKSHGSKRLCIPFHEFEMLRKNIPNKAAKPVEYNNDRTVAPLRIVKKEEKKSFLEKREILFPLPFLFQNIISLT